MARVWSPYQKAIFKFIRTGEGNCVVEAVAGSGKTTTIVEAYKFCEGSTVFLAFNKAIASELSEKGLNSKTFHSLTYTPVLSAKRGRILEQDKTRKLFREMIGDDKLREMYSAFVCRLVGLAKQNGIAAIREDIVENWTSIIDHHSLELDSDDADLDHAIMLSRDLLKISNDHPKWVDFDDMLYLSVKDKIKLPKFRNIFVDEAQDTNAIQRAILRKIRRTDKNGSRLFAVGDPHQAIYGFRGADSDSMKLIERQFNCVRLPLTVSYRCPRSIVAHAQKWVKHIEHAPDAPAGEVRELKDAWVTKDFLANDMVVCRTTRPLIALGYTLLKERIPFYIMGRDIGQNLKKLVERQRVKTIDSLEPKLQKWAEREIGKAMKKEDLAKAESIQDKYDALSMLISSLPENSRTVSELTHTIDLLFEEKRNAVILCTIHKSKGLEANRVWWLNASLCPAKWASGWQYQQEENLCYVATTRAKQELRLIDERRQDAVHESNRISFGDPFSRVLSPEAHMVGVPGNGHLMYSHGVLVSADDGNGQTWEISDDEEGDGQ